MDWQCFVCKSHDIDLDCDFYHDKMARIISFSTRDWSQCRCAYHDAHLKCFHEWVTRTKAKTMASLLDVSEYMKFYTRCIFCRGDVLRCSIRKSIHITRALRSSAPRVVSPVVEVIPTEMYFDPWRDYFGLNRSLSS